MLTAAVQGSLFIALLGGMVTLGTLLLSIEHSGSHTALVISLLALPLTAVFFVVDGVLLSTNRLIARSVLSAVQPASFFVILAASLAAGFSLNVELVAGFFVATHVTAVIASIKWLGFRHQLTRSIYGRRSVLKSLSIYRECIPLISNGLIVVGQIWIMFALLARQDGGFIAVGQANIALQVRTAVLTLVYSIQTIDTPKLARASKNPQELDRTLSKTLYLATALAFGLILMTPAITFAFSSTEPMAESTFFIVAVAVVVIGLSNIFGIFLQLHGHGRRTVKWNILQLFIAIFLLEFAFRDINAENFVVALTVASAVQFLGHIREAQAAGYFSNRAILQLGGLIIFPGAAIFFFINSTILPTWAFRLSVTTIFTVYMILFIRRLTSR
jgi:O-antigen/teichoic acid export membrane protein